MNPEGQYQEKALSKLKYHVQEREEEKGSNDIRGKGHFEDRRAELHILATSLHADCPPAPVQEGVKHRCELQKGYISIQLKVDMVPRCLCI